MLRADNNSKTSAGNTEVLTPDQDVFPPSYFANRGKPCCSRWGKSEIEWIALAYVQALENDGDTWKTLTRERTYELLSDEQKEGTHGLLTHDFYHGWFEMVSGQIADSEGAFGVGGFWDRRSP